MSSVIKHKVTAPHLDTNSDLCSATTTHNLKSEFQARSAPATMHSSEKCKCQCFICITHQCMHFLWDLHTLLRMHFTYKQAFFQRHSAMAQTPKTNQKWQTCFWFSGMASWDLFFFFVCVISWQTLSAEYQDNHCNCHRNNQNTIKADLLARPTKIKALKDSFVL